MGSRVKTTWRLGSSFDGHDGTARVDFDSFIHPLTNSTSNNMPDDHDDCNDHGTDPLVIENDADVAKHAAGVQDAKSKGVLAIDMDDVLW